MDNDDSGTGLPASIEAAWGLRERPHKGPKPGLSLERIVQAGVQVATSNGLGAVSMSRVAAALGASTMSLYRYVTAKDELLTLMVDAACGPPPAAPDPDEGWRAGLSRWAEAYYGVLCRQRWIVRVPISGPPATPNVIAWLEDGLRSLRGTGLAEGEKLSVILLLSGFVRNQATLVADIQEAVAGAVAAGAAPPDTAAYGRALTRLADPGRFPRLHAVIAAGIFDEPDDIDAEFTFGLARILDGVEALVRTRTGPRTEGAGNGGC